MIIEWEKLDEVNREKYLEFQEEVERRLNAYKEENPGRFSLVEDIIDGKSDKWDKAISIDKNGEIQDINITKLLVYEYCLAQETVTQKRVNFAEALGALSKKLDKFRIGNPVKGEDDECLYSRNLEDKKGIPVTSKLYRLVSSAEAQTLGYMQDEKFRGAVFLYSKDRDENFAEDENGNLVGFDLQGIDFYHIDQEQSLLNNLRQTAFHEWNHINERDFIDREDPDAIEYETKGLDGRVNINYDEINSYYTSEDIGDYTEPTYVISNEKDENNRRKRFYKDEEGNLRPLSEVDFGLSKKDLYEPICISTGLETEEKNPDGKLTIHNRITEGFVEYIAREMVKAISDDEDCVARGRYASEVKIAGSIIRSRDKSIDDSESGKGKTIADFLQKSSILKKELEGKVVEKEDGIKVNGLQYVQDKSEDEFLGRSKKAKFFKEQLPVLVKTLALTTEQILKMKKLIGKGNKLLSKETIEAICLIAAGTDSVKRNAIKLAYDTYMGIVNKEAEENDSIGEILGYAIKGLVKGKSMSEIGSDAKEGIANLSKTLVGSDDPKKKEEKEETSTVTKESSKGTIVPKVNPKSNEYDIDFFD